MTAPPPPLFLDVIEQGELVLVRVDGAINEDNRLAERMRTLSGRKLLMNMEKFERINSCGVRDWVRWVQSLEERGNTLHLVRCSPTVVAQVNMVNNFCGANGHVVSFLAPYFCENCRRDHHENLMSQGVSPGDGAPAAICETCGEPMEFDDLPQSYFAFTRIHGPRPVDPAVQDAIHRFGDAFVATKVAALKEISSGRSGAPAGAGSAPIGTPRPLAGQRVAGGPEGNEKIAKKS